MSDRAAEACRERNVVDYQVIKDYTTKIIERAIYKKASGNMSANFTINSRNDIATQPVEQGMSQNVSLAASYKLNYRHDLTGLKAMPAGSYERIKLKNVGDQKGS